VRVHDADYLTAKLRLYMTATPRIFDENVKDKADQHSAELVSMDDEYVYGPEFHRLSFGDAVERGLLSDYKVLVLTVDRSVMAPRLQKELAGVAGELQLDDASKIVGCWNGLAKRAGTAPDGTGFTPGEAPMRRAVAFARDIKTSKQVAETFPLVVEAYGALLDAREDDGLPVDDTNRGLRCEVHHVDGTYNALERNAELTWLKGVVADDECRILINARCLSEGVDVPALDAVLFLNPRNSVVDVVQSVGRVMRKAPGKDYGYVILPVAVPEGVAPSEALSDNQRFKVVWQVLNALRSHDERFDAMVNSIALNADTKGGKGTTQLFTDHVGPTTDDPEASDPDTTAKTTTQMALFSLSEWQEAIYARIVDKVGTRTYWEDWAKDVADIAATLITRITALLDDADPTIGKGFDQFLKGLRDNLNDSISRDDAVSMLAQHLITAPVFDALFAGHDFASHNPVSKAMQSMVDTLGDAGLEAETQRLEGFYESVRRRAGEVSSAEGKQQVIAELYEKFFRVGFKKQADALGIVYTPVEIVDFILRAADTASREHFGRGLTAEGVHILDGFVGTGTFITRLLQSDLITPQDLARKYASELHANEIMLLAYYIAAVNIETTYHALAGKTAGADDYEPFNGIVLADTFQISEADDSLDSVMFPQNNDRIVRQLETPINVVVGNPPYSVGQDSANDNNANVIYPTLDNRIRETYLAARRKGGSNSMFDSYVRAFRWATDRVGQSGVVAFVVNGGWIDGNTADGMRLALADEYAAIYIYNLRGNGRIGGEQGRKEGRPVFEFGGWRPDGSEIKSSQGGSRATIAIVLLVKVADHVSPAEIRYAEVADALSAGEKIRAVAEAGEFSGLSMREIIPNDHGDWLSQRNDEFLGYPPIGDKSGSAAVTYFASYSRGLETGRDAWVHSYSKFILTANVRRAITFFEDVRLRYQQWLAAHAKTKGAATRDEFIDAHSDYVNDPKSFSWTLSTKNRLSSDTPIDYEPASVIPSTYRPFQPQWAYFSRGLNHIVGRLPSMFPTSHHPNEGFYVVGAGSAVPFSAIMLDTLPNLHVTGAGSGGQFFPRWTYELVDSDSGTLDFADSGDVDEYGYRRVDNITDEILALYRSTLGDAVTKDDIFYSVYAQLHDPDYREKYAADLKKMLPHIPTPENIERFKQLAAAGGALAELHINYEAVEPYPLDLQLKLGADPGDRETWRVRKMKWAKKKNPETGKSVDDKTTIIYNTKVTITGIPEEAERYMLGSRSALAWIIDRYQVKVDKASGIVNDPNDWCDEHDDPIYIVDLIKKVTTVAVETTRIVDSL